MQNKTKKLLDLRKDAEAIFRAGLAAVEPAAAINRYCRCDQDILFAGSKQFNLSEFDNLFIIGSGKAGAPMAGAMEKILDDKITKGLINVKYGHLGKTKRIVLKEAGHPVPDEKGAEGAQAIFELARKAGSNDLVICLISGGGSALLPLPAPGISLQDKKDTIKALLACGAPIHEINAIRKHISMIKGGRLAQACYPASLITLMLSDVVGDDPDVIASGPTVPDASTFRDCLNIIKNYSLETILPSAVLAHIQEGIGNNDAETPKPGSPVFEKVENIIIGTCTEAIMAAKKEAESRNYNTLVLSSMIQGETKHVAGVHTAVAKEIRKTGMPLSPPACVLSGGETTVTLTGSGKGGRNQEFALAAAIDMAGEKDMLILSAGTDGTDGPTNAAGAFAHPETLRKAKEADLNAALFLKENDSYHFLQKTGDLFITGPTNTNVMDLRIMLIL